MAMLAERRRKQKWSLNPNGKEWSLDSNKFGQKLLEKMGWQNGKGLGAKEDGMTEHIKVSHKIDSKGMGYKEKNDQWTEHEDNFTALLSSLSGDKNEEESTEIQLKSLEKKSQSSRARVHYHKFTRGKDLSRYSEKDLANIFGKKSLKVATKKEGELKDIKGVEKTDSDKESGLYFNGGSMKDYFKKKIPNFGKINDFIVGNNGVLKKAEDSESESDMRPSFGFGFKSHGNSSNHTTFVSYIQENSTPTKRKAEDNLKEEVFSPAKKHKKDKKQKDKDNLGLSNPGFDPLASPNKILQKHVLDPIEENSSENMDFSVISQSEEHSETFNEKEKENIGDVSIRKKKKKKKIDETPTEIVEQDSLDSQKKTHKKKKKQTDIPLNDDETNSDSTKDDLSLQNQNISMEESSTIDSSSVKKQKKKNKTVAVENPCFNDSMDISNQTTEENPYEVKQKKSKKKKSKAEAVENPCFNESVDISTSTSCTTEENPYEVKPKKEKKKKTKMVALENPCFNESIEDESDKLENSIITNSVIEENPYEVKPKKEKKKKTKTLAVDNPGFNESMDVSINDTENNTIEENPYEVRPKKEKKKKSKSASTLQEENTIKEDENITPTNNDSVIHEEFDLMLNIVSTPILKKDKPLNIESEPRVNKMKRRKSVRFSDVTQELIIPNNEDLKEMYETNSTSPTNLDAISKTLDNFQAEMENDINEEKIKSVSLEDIMVGEVGNPHGENEKLPEGTKLKFKYANLNAKTPFYQMDKVGPKKSYKHLIKGDILLKFSNTNLHEIDGYGAKNKTAA